MPFDVFISFKHLDESGEPTADSKLAASIYSYLKDQGMNPFSSEITLEEKGTSRFKRAIDDALDDCFALVVVGTKREHLVSEWVRYEWDGFFNDILSGIKPDGKVFSYVDGIRRDQLPRALRQSQSIIHGKDSLPRLYQFIVGDDRVNEERESRVAPLASAPPASAWTHPLLSRCLDKRFVYISAVSEDRKTVERINKALDQQGIHVFNSAPSGIVIWSQSRHQQEMARACTLFIPVISKATESRHEGRFRQEWALAAERALRFSPGVRFIIPVLTADVDSPRLIPREFEKLQHIRIDDDESLRRLAATVTRYMKDRL